MSGHNHLQDGFAAAVAGETTLVWPGASATLDLEGKTDCYVDAEDDFSLPNTGIPIGTRVFVNNIKAGSITVDDGQGDHTISQNKGMMFVRESTDAANGWMGSAEYSQGS